MNNERSNTKHPSPMNPDGSLAPLPVDMLTIWDLYALAAVFGGMGWESAATLADHLVRESSRQEYRDMDNEKLAIENGR